MPGGAIPGNPAAGPKEPIPSGAEKDPFFRVQKKPDKKSPTPPGAEKAGRAARRFSLQNFRIQAETDPPNRFDIAAARHLFQLFADIAHVHADGRLFAVGHIRLDIFQ